jgi:iron complex outermembrane receptor protein
MYLPSRAGFPALACLLACVPATLTAAEDAPGDGRVREVIVTAVPLPDPIQPAIALTRDDLFTRLAPTLGETLDREVGISSTYFGPAASRPVIRGLTGSRVTVLTDSVATLDVADVSPDHAVTIEPLLADRIEVVRGPLALFYGSAAAGGVVNVIDNRIPERLPERTVTGAAEARGDTALGERAFVGRLDGGSGRFAWHLDGYTRETDDVEIPGFATADPAERPEDEPRGSLRNSASDTDGVAGGAAYIGERGFLGIGWSAYNANYGLPGPGEAEEGEEEGEALFPGPLLDLEQRRVDVRGEYRPGGLVEAVRLAVGVNDYRHTEVEPSGEPATRFDNDAWQGRIEVRHAAVAGFRGAVGLQYDDRDLAAVGEEAFIAPTATEALGVFIAEQRQFGPTTLQLGARIEDLEHTPSGDLPRYDEAALSLAIGAAYDFGGDYRLTANLARTERNPAPEELYADGAHLATRLFEVGLLTANESVEKEVSLNVDLGIARTTGDLAWSVSAFFNDFTDYVYLAETGEVEDGLPVAEYLQQDARFWGLEAEVTAGLGDFGGFDMSGRLFADYVRAELSGGGDLPRIPPLRLGAGLGASRGPWSLAADVIHHVKQDDISTFNTDAFTLVSLDASYAREFRGAEWQVFVRGANLADEDARRSASFLAAFAPLPGRALQGGLRVAF